MNVVYFKYRIFSASVTKSSAPYGCVVLCSFVFPCTALSDSSSREGKELVMGACPIHAAIFSGKTRSDKEAVGVKKVRVMKNYEKGEYCWAQRC